jgi:hypothetical protein
VHRPPRHQHGVAGAHRQHAVVDQHLALAGDDVDQGLVGVLVLLVELAGRDAHHARVHHLGRQRQALDGELDVEPGDLVGVQRDRLAARPVAQRGVGEVLRQRHPALHALEHRLEPAALQRGVQILEEHHAEVERVIDRLGAGLEPARPRGVRQHHVLERDRVLVVARDVDVEELEVALGEPGGDQAFAHRGVHAGDHALGAERQERGARDRPRLDRVVEVVAHELAGRRAVADRRQVGDVEPGGQEAAKDLRVAALGLAAAALFPQVLRQLGAEQVVVAIGHHRRDEPGEARRVQVVLREYISQIVAGQRTVGERRHQRAAPERVLGLPPAQRGERRDRRINGNRMIGSYGGGDAGHFEGGHVGPLCTCSASHIRGASPENR